MALPDIKKEKDCVCTFTTPSEYRNCRTGVQWPMYPLAVVDYK